MDAAMSAPRHPKLQCKPWQLICSKCEQYLNARIRAVRNSSNYIVRSTASGAGRVASSPMSFEVHCSSARHLLMRSSTQVFRSLPLRLFGPANSAHSPIPGHRSMTAWLTLSASQTRPISFVRSSQRSSQTQLSNDQLPSKRTSEASSAVDHLGTALLPFFNPRRQIRAP